MPITFKGLHVGLSTTQSKNLTVLWERVITQAVTIKSADIHTWDVIKMTHSYIIYITVFSGRGLKAVQVKNVSIFSIKNLLLFYFNVTCYIYHLG